SREERPCWPLPRSSGASPNSGRRSSVRPGSWTRSQRPCDGSASRLPVRTTGIRSRPHAPGASSRTRTPSTTWSVRTRTPNATRPSWSDCTWTPEASTLPRWTRHWEASWDVRDGMASRCPGNGPPDSFASLPRAPTGDSFPGWAQACHELAPVTALQRAHPLHRVAVTVEAALTVQYQRQADVHPQKSRFVGCCKDGLDRCLCLCQRDVVGARQSLVERGVAVQLSA